MNINEEAQNLRKLKEIKDDAREKHEIAKLAYAEAQQQLMDAMEAAGVEGIKAEGVNFIPASTIYGTVRDRAKFVKWAEENRPDLVTKVEMKDRINELARQIVDDGGEFPPGLDFRTTDYISQRVTNS